VRVGVVVAVRVGPGVAVGPGVPPDANSYAPMSSVASSARTVPSWCFTYSRTTACAGSTAASSAVPAFRHADPASRWKSCPASSTNPGDAPVTFGTGVVIVPVSPLWLATNPVLNQLLRRASCPALSSIARRSPVAVT
jgi:hypothetical protein